MPDNTISQNPYANARTAGEIRKVSDRLMKDNKKTGAAPSQKEGGNNDDFKVSISTKAKAKTSSKKTNPYANAHTADEIRKVSDTLMQGVKKSINKIA